MVRKLDSVKGAPVMREDAPPRNRPEGSGVRRNVRA
jgi:hypothetical protein